MHFKSNDDDAFGEYDDPDLIDDEEEDVLDHIAELERFIDIETRQARHRVARPAPDEPESDVRLTLTT